MKPSRIDNALCDWMPLEECVISRYVRVGTPEAEDLLRRTAAALRAARRAHRLAMTQHKKRPATRYNPPTQGDQPCDADAPSISP